MKRSERATVEASLSRSVLRVVCWLLAAIVTGLGVGIGVSIVVDSVVERRAVVEVVTDWGSYQRTVEPLPSLPGSRPVLVKNPGDPARVCELSRWPGSPCVESGLSPRIDYGTAPQLERVYHDAQGWVAVLSYTDATDQLTNRWVVVSVARDSDRSWYVHAFADVPLSSEPDEEQTRAILQNTRRCEPTTGPTGC